MNEIAPGIWCEVLEDGKIQTITVKSVARASVDAWANHVTDNVNQWDASKPYLMLYDFSDPKVSFTSYIRQKSSELTELRPEVRGKVAVVMMRNPVNFLVMVFAQVRPRASRQIKIFFDRESALNWLNDRTTTQEQQTRETDT